MKLVFVVFTKFCEVSEDLRVSICTWSFPEFPTHCLFEDIDLQVSANKFEGVVSNLDRVVVVEEMIEFSPLFFVLSRPQYACLYVGHCFILSTNAQAFGRC